MRKLNPAQMECDKRILLIVVILLAVGASLVASSSSYFSTAKFSDPYFLLKRHLVRMLIAGLFLILAMHIDYRIFRKLSPVALTVGIAMLVGLLIFGHAIRDTMRWYHVRFLQVTFQPSEMARLSLVLFLAYWVARKGESLQDFKSGFLPPAAAIVAVLGLMAAQPNYGSASATAIIAFLMLYLGGVRIRHLTVLGLSVAGVALLRVISGGYVRERIVAYFNRSEGIGDMNWQLYQSLVGLGSGGPLGLGFGESRQKLNWLPDSHTDFIFSILGEEAGLIGTLLVSLLFLLLVLRALKISTNSGDKFGQMLVIGIGCSIFVYAMLNMSVATGLFPVTGLPLPFLSYGGSALVVNAFSVGILLNVSKRTSLSNPSRRRRRPLRVYVKGERCV
ncbi:MAG: putative lipid II flippase FtsW [Candidatus Krumholzibacteria bacterium]|nr:putative lipid II flippase FtsW [Candidatus Krumholzibacteria bacterium]